VACDDERCEMADGSNATTTGAPRTGLPASRAVRPRRSRGEPRLGAVAVVFTLAQLVLVRPGLGLGWDETVYVSQVSGHVPAAYFSAPRSRGISLLVAPIASWSDSTVLLRVYLAVLSGLALYLALRVWRGHLGPGVLALAGALFASLWVTLFYGPQAMPNYWVAIGALACVGCFLRARANARDRAAWWGVFAGAALMALMRPMDAVYIVLPLLALCLLSLRHPRLLVVLVVGLVAGAGEWVIEAYTSYGGLAQRLSAASGIQGGLGWHLAVLDQLHSLGGRTLCRPCTGSAPNPAVTLWWFALPLLAVLGSVVAVRTRRALPVLLPGACAVTAAVPYLFLVGYAAPRFLLPAYALLALPVALGLVHLVTAPARRAGRTLAVGLLAVGLAGHLAVQYAVLEHTVHSSAASRAEWARTAAALHALGVRQPCLLSGYDAVPIAYYTGCGSAQTAGHDASTSVAELTRAAHRTSFAVLAPPGRRAPAYARTWPDERVGVLQAYVAPDAQRGR
jgi:Tfp pilus assembly protein PilV